MFHLGSSAYTCCQTDFARSKFVEALQNYQAVERDYRQRYKQRVERQFRIGKFPDTHLDSVANYPFYS